MRFLSNHELLELREVRISVFSPSQAVLMAKESMEGRGMCCHKRTAVGVRNRWFQLLRLC